MSLGEHGLAVVDCETTGLFPGYHHRVIELAVIQMFGDGEVETEWHTLLNPDRDLGETDIHGIRGADVAEAPRFSELIGDILDLLRGRVVIAHNLRFDRSFLEAELARAGFKVGPLPGLCTIALSQRAGLRAARLDDCCRHLGIETEASHQALSDARACARLFSALVTELEIRDTDLDHLGCSSPAPEWPAATSTGSVKPRSESRAARPASYLSRLVENRAEVVIHSADAGAYLELLDRALEDRRLSEPECDDVRRAAEMYGLSGTALEDAHGRYLDVLCETALADGVVTDRERYDLELVAQLLDLGDLDKRLAAVELMGSSPSTQPGRDDLAGQSVCFTGKLLCSVDGDPVTRSRAEELARAAGLEVTKNVTKRLDILVVADPDTLSGKAKKARDYGTRVIAEASFWPLIGVDVE